MNGFQIVETMRDRAASREMEAQRLSLAQIASSRADTELKSEMDMRARAYDQQDQNKRTLAARARVMTDPDKANPEDIKILQQGGDAETLAALDSYHGRRAFATKSLGDLAASGVAQPGAGDPAATQAQGPPAQYTPQQDQYLSPDADSSMPDTQFPQPRSVPFEEVKDYLAPGDPQTELAARRGKGHENIPAFKTGVRVDIPPGVMTTAEIRALPLPEQEAARTKNKELLGNRVSTVESLRANDAGGDKQKGLNKSYETFLDPGKDSDVRNLATTQPTAWIAQYRKDRMSLDPNTRALVDARAPEVAQQSLANLVTQSHTIPQGKNGMPDTNSEEWKNLKSGIEHNIAVLQATSKGFSAADAANIRGGSMPIGNAELAGRVTQAWQNQPAPAMPSTPTEERVAGTQMRNLAEAAAKPGGLKKISSGQVNNLGKAVARGWISYDDAESILTTGRVKPSALQFFQANTKEDLFLNGHLVRRGYDPEAIAKAEKESGDKLQSGWDKQFELLYPGDKEAEKSARGRKKGEFLTWMSSNRDSLMKDHGIDPYHADPYQAAALANAYAAQDQATDQYSKAWFGMKQWVFGNPREQGAGPFTDQTMQITKDILGPNWGVNTLGNQTFDYNRAYQYALKSGDPRDRAAAMSTVGNPQALGIYFQQKIASQKGQ